MASKSNVYPPLEKWQRNALSHPNQVPRLPTFVIEDMPVDEAQSIKGFYNSRGWEHCQNSTCSRSGTEYKLMKCAACGPIPGRHALYCSRRCQRLEWPEHRQNCRDSMLRELEDAAQTSFRLGLDPQIWQNCNRMAAKRGEGLRMILVWLFNIIYKEYPNINLRETCLTVYFRSSNLGKGIIVPIAYQLVPMTKTSWGLPPPSVFENDKPGAKTGVVQFNIDTVDEDRIYFNINVYQSFRTQSQQWPWIFASVAAMFNYNALLWMKRLEYLHQVIDTLVYLRMPEVLRFKAPNDLDNGNIWELCDFGEWTGIFGDIISF